MNKNGFSNIHPIVLFMYFLTILSIIMLIANPFIQIIGITFGYRYAKTIKKSRKFFLYVMILGFFINVLFNHNGITILFYLPTGNPITLESVISAGAYALMLGASILWFSCFSIVMTSDKVHYLFSKISKTLALILSMILSFIPRFYEHYEDVKLLNKCEYGKLKTAIFHYTIMTTWMLENTVKIGQSMKNRGYSTGKRTSYTIYKFQKKDVKIMFGIAMFVVSMSIFLIKGEISYEYYPIFEKKDSLLAYLIFAIYANIPLYLENKEEKKWSKSQSKI